MGPIGIPGFAPAASKGEKIILQTQAKHEKLIQLIWISYRFSKGEKGEQGTRGFDGRNGESGRDGLPGLKGERGERGPAVR